MTGGPDLGNTRRWEVPMCQSSGQNNAGPIPSMAESLCEVRSVEFTLGTTRAGDCRW